MLLKSTRHLKRRAASKSVRRIARLQLTCSLLTLLRLNIGLVLVGCIAASTCVVVASNAGTGCDETQDSLASTLSTNRPTWWPKERQYGDYEALAQSVTPSFNDQAESGLVECGDERQFLLMRQADPTDRYSRIQTVKQGHSYDLYIFFHNIKLRGDRPVPTSHGTRIFLEASEFLYDTETYTATIRSDNAMPAAVTSSIVLQPEIGVGSTYMKPVRADAFSADGTQLYELATDDLTSKSGAAIGCLKPDGEVPADCSGYIIVKYDAKRVSQIVGIFAADSPDGPWKNSQVLSRPEPFWLRFRFVNTGQVVVESASVAFKFKLELPWNPSIGVNQNPYVIGTVVEKKQLDLDTLVQGVNMGPVEPGNSVNILVPISVGDQWRDKICESGSLTIDAVLDSSYFVSSTRVLSIYPENGVCPK